MILPRDLATIVLCYSFAYLWLHFSLFFEIGKKQNVLQQDGTWSYDHISAEINHAYKWISPSVLKSALDRFIFYFIRQSSKVYLLILCLVCFALYTANQSYYQIPNLVYTISKVLILIHVLLIFVHYTLCVRFRGLYNGGSDMMMMVIAIGHLINLICIVYHKNFMWGFLFIAVNLIVSYFKAGIVKAQNADWLNGNALKHFMTHTNCLTARNNQLFIQIIRHKSAVWVAISYLTLFVELGFPLVLLSKMTFWLFAVWALMFHFFNFLVFGLNRFFWTWMLAWPALFYLLKLLHNF